MIQGNFCRFPLNQITRRGEVASVTGMRTKQSIAEPTTRVESRKKLTFMTRYSIVTKWYVVVHTTLD